ncbi:class I adenylate-forming enzyme family protein [Nocardia brasiliensis]|uniref:Synthetase n=1 Tax=Nocardia brasiliensis (strain ATCC 700358 / HUJEG-1) TaxID=1133849 RepID=K0EMM5_NOCB7|nr:AMP-binding protein [Nocardia brasiliensis]AFU00823.1 synthetase [Nocardia brasiliensis ATCC 700358]OCF84069.1 synthetase [Nocardia brasiliensis]
MRDPGLGGSGARPAIEFVGRTYTYAELDRAIEQWIEQHPGATSYDASALDVPDALICVCAAARRGVPVFVENPAARPARTDLPASAFLLVTTSGSTGRPRPLARTAASWYDSFPAFTAITGVTAADRVLLTGPLYATMHLFGALHALWLGACVTDDPARATVVHAVPAVLREVVGRAPALRTAIVAGIALDDGARAAAAGLELIEYYGSAEVSLVAARRVPEPLRLLDGVEAEIRAGLLYVRTPYRVLGAPEWFGVGDLAELGPERELTVRGRGESAINVGGTTVLAEDVERVLGAIDGVAAVAVIGAPHAVLGEIVTAAVQLDGDVGIGAVRAHARRVLLKEAMPRRWVPLPALPRTASGKVARGELKDLLA